MRHLFIILLLLLTATSFCQSDEIYKLTFGDTSNFRLTTYLDHKRPAKFFVIDTTDTWRTERFWLRELNEKSTQVIKRMEGDEHHPYNHTYLFRDTTLDRLISASEKKSLSQKSGTLKSKRIALKGKNYLTVSSSRNIKGFYFVTTKPVFTSDMKYAFIDMVVFYKENLNQDLNETYFGTICVAYEKQQDNKWKKIKVKNHLIL
jgi:hypothetical protein